jgi:hypothetical protein
MRETTESWCGGGGKAQIMTGYCKDKTSYKEQIEYEQREEIFQILSCGKYFRTSIDR